MAVVDVAAVDGGGELDHLAGVQRAIDLVDGVLSRRPMLDDGIGDLSKGAADLMHALEVTGGHARMRRGVLASALGTLAVDQPAIGEPAQREIEARELLDEETIVAIQGVQEVEGGLDVDVVGVTPIGGGRTRRCHRVTTLRLLTGYAQEGTVR